MEVNLTPIIVLAIGLVVALAINVVVPLIRSKVTESEWDMIMRYTKATVQAAEIIYGAGAGEAKFNAVMQQVETYCREHKIKIDSNQIKIAIENAWKELGFAHDDK